MGKSLVSCFFETQCTSTVISYLPSVDYFKVNFCFSVLLSKCVKGQQKSLKQNKLITYLPDCSLMTFSVCVVTFKYMFAA